MTSNEEEKVKQKRKRQIKKWDNFTINLNQAMQDVNYFQEWVLSGAVDSVDDLFPGESRDWITTLLRKWEERGDKNQFSLQALKIFCTIKDSDPNTVLGVQSEPKAKQKTSSNTNRIIYFAWNDVEKIVRAINEDTSSFCKKNKCFPILIPIMCNRKDLILVCLRIDKFIDSETMKYDMVYYDVPHVCGLYGGQVEKMSDRRKALAIYSTDKDCIKNLKERYRTVAEHLVITDDLFSSTFDEINKLISGIFNRVRPSFQGKFFDFCPTEDYYQTLQCDLEQKIAQSRERASVKNRN